MENSEKRKTLIIIDMQNDFITGSLKNPAADAIVEPLTKFIKTWSPDFANIICTLDTHETDYLDTNEGKNLPVEHCIRNTAGWCIDDRIQKALRGKNWERVQKPTFGSLKWNSILSYLEDTGKNERIILTGTCTDICVVSNALILKAAFPDADVEVISDLCAGLSPELHEAALKVMKSCQVKITTSKDWRK